MDLTGEAARLPQGRLERTIDDLREGESAWTVPWAMDVDADQRCWLRRRYTVADRPGGTVQMMVERNEDGFHVWIPDDARWHVSGGIPDGIAVAAVHVR